MYAVSLGWITESLTPAGYHHIMKQVCTMTCRHSCHTCSKYNSQIQSYLTRDVTGCVILGVTHRRVDPDALLSLVLTGLRFSPGLWGLLHCCHPQLQVAIGSIAFSDQYITQRLQKYAASPGRPDVADVY